MAHTTINPAIAHEMEVALFINVEHQQRFEVLNKGCLLASNSPLVRITEFGMVNINDINFPFNLKRLTNEQINDNILKAAESLTQQARGEHTIQTDKLLAIYYTAYAKKYKLNDTENIENIDNP